MRRTSHFSLAFALAFGGVLGLSMVVPADAAFAKKEKKEEAPKYDLSKEFSKSYSDISKQVESGDTAGAEQALTALGTANEDEQFLAGNLWLSLGSKASKPAFQKRGLKMMLESGVTPPEDLARFHFFAGQFEYQDENFAEARKHLSKAIELGYDDPKAYPLVAEAYFKEDMFAEGLSMLKQGIRAEQATGKTPDESWVMRGASIAYSNKLGASAIEWAEILVDTYPTPNNWRSAVGIVRENLQFNEQENLDVLRLMRRTNALQSEADYGEYLEAANPGRLPAEVIAVYQEGLDDGVITADNEYFADVKKDASARLAGDKASLGDSEADSRTAADGKIALATGDALLGYEQFAKAEEMYTIALQKGGIDQGRAMTRLAIAQVEQGKFDEAKAQLAKVSGTNRTAIASLWEVYIDNQTAASASTGATAETADSASM